MFVDPASLASRERRRVFKYAVRKLGGAVELRTFPLPRRISRLISSPYFVLASIRVSGSEELMKVLRKLKFKLSKRPVVRPTDVRILADLELNVKEKPVGVSLDGSRLVFAPAEGLIHVTDPRLAALLIYGERSVLWIEARGMSLDDLGLQRLPHVPLASISRRLVSDISLALATLTVGRQHAERIESALSSLKPEVEEEEEMTEILAGPQSVVDALVKWRIVSPESGEIPERAYIDVTGAPYVVQLFALLFGLLSGYEYVVVNGVMYTRRLVDYIRPTIIWVSRDPPDESFSVSITDSRVRVRVDFRGQPVILEETFRPFWEL